MELRQGKFTRHLIGFEKEKLKSFLSYLKSPSNNSNSKLSKLFSEILKFWPNFDHKNYNLNYFYKRVFGSDEKFNASKINKYFHDLNLHWLKFLAVEEMFGSKENWIPYTITSFQKLGKSRAAEVLIKDQIKILRKKGRHDTSDYLLLSKYYRQLFDISVGQARHGDLELMEQHRLCQDKYYYLQTLTNSLTLRSRNDFFQRKHKESRDPRVHKFVASIDKDSEPIFDLYLLILHFFNNKSEEHYHIIKQRYFEVIDKLNLSQRLIIHSCLGNFIFYFIKSGVDSFLKEQFILYKFGVSHKIYGDKVIRSQPFINIVAASCLAKEINYAKEFLNQHKNKIDKPYKSDTLLVSKAFIAFHESKFDEAHRLASKIKSDKAHFQLRSKTLLLRCIYEFARKDPSYEKTLSAKAIALERYFTRDITLSNDNVEAYLNFVRTLKSLSSKTARNETKKFKIKATKKLNAYKHIIAKTWLAEKINEL